MAQKDSSALRRSLVLFLSLSVSFSVYFLVNLIYPAPSLAVPLFLSQSPEEKLPDQVESAVRTALAAQTGLGATQFRLLAAQAQTWPNGCLGLAQPQELCTQALVQGWRVKMGHGDKVWVYRTNQQGNQLRLE